MVYISRKGKHVLGRTLIRTSGRTCLCLVFRTSIAKPVRYDWENDHYDEMQDPFLKQFDEEGNFIEPTKDEPNTTDSSIEVHYSFKDKTP